MSGKEHLLFYGRLKGLTGTELVKAAEAALKSVHLFNYGVGDMLAREYSGGMKRRLAVAISLIGNPRVVYLDEPSTVSRTGRDRTKNRNGGLQEHEANSERLADPGECKSIA